MSEQSHSLLRLAVSLGLLLGRPLSEGRVLLATTIHASFFFAYLIPAAIIYPFSLKRARPVSV